MYEKNRGFFPNKEEIKKAIYTFSYRKMIFFLLMLGVFIVSGFLILNKINQKFLIERPLKGGSITEGVIGSPRFINPVLATTPTDEDLVNLIFSGLMKKDENQNVVEDLAESYEISESGNTYVFKIKESAKFHDGAPVRADDVIFTINQIKDGTLKSPEQQNWSNVSLTKIDEKTIEFRLGSQYASFLENTTIGILPSHIWQQAESGDFIFSDFNIDAVGSGPYKIKNIDKKKNGLIESITLKYFKDYVGSEQYIDTIKFNFYRNKEDLLRAFQKNKVDNINSISGYEAQALIEEGYNVKNIKLSRVFGLFFNANKQEIFRNKQIVKAVELGINKDEIVSSVLNGYGEKISGPIPTTILSKENTEEKDYAARLEEANSILSKEGWTLSENGYRVKDGKTLSFSISTGDASELQQASNIIKENLKNIGIMVEVKVFEIANLNQSIIRPREYESLFFGQIITNDSDLFAFWHSSQRNDPGLNISSYTNSKVDGLLQRLIATKDLEEKQKLMLEIDAEITKDMPAVFIYSPNFIYAVNEKIKNINLEKIILPSDRLNNIEGWYIRTEKVWKFLNN
jgi:peptide/nickel transport system substrate-binding protein